MVAVGELGAFLKIDRLASVQRDPRERVSDYREFVTPVADAELQAQGARCMDCGVPFCHTGCPLNNIIPDWNDMVYRGRWKEAIRTLHATNNFPEFTGRICPAPCEAACVLGINEQPVTIKQIGKKPELLDDEAVAGRAIKCISMLLPALPEKHQYKVIFMLLPIAEVVASQHAMTTRLGTQGSNLDPAQLELGLRAHRVEGRHLGTNAPPLHWL